jgi:hypothetical protein
LNYSFVCRLSLLSSLHSKSNQTIGIGGGDTTTTTTRITRQDDNE